MHPCECGFLVQDYAIVLRLCLFFRFKRVGPNAMKGRGIGTARGRATIMRGTFVIERLPVDVYAADRESFSYSKWQVPHYTIHRGNGN